MRSFTLLGGIQFDNSTLDLTGMPRRLIYRLSWNASSNSFQYVLTALTFLSETLEPLEIRINFRTNLWSACLSNVPVFQDIPFYTGSSTKNFGSTLVKMAVINTTTTTLLPPANPTTGLPAWAQRGRRRLPSPTRPRLRRVRHRLPFPPSRLVPVLRCQASRTCSPQLS